MGDSRVAIVHGDAHSLSGWSFAIESMEPLDGEIMQSLGCSDNSTSPQQPPQVTTTGAVSDWLEEAQVDCFACTHTCLPFAQAFNDNCSSMSRGVVVNNGSAGMPNFREKPGVSLITRIATINKNEEVHIPEGSLYGMTMGDLRIDAIEVKYDHGKWMSRFLKSWPPKSPAHESYCSRIVNGTDLSVNQAAREGFTLTNNQTRYHRK